MRDKFVVVCAEYRARPTTKEIAERDVRVGYPFCNSPVHVVMPANYEDVRARTGRVVSALVCAECETPTPSEKALRSEDPVHDERVWCSELCMSLTGERQAQS